MKESLIPSDRQCQRKNYFHFGIQSLFLLWTTKYVTGMLHEIFHGLGGLSGGLKFLGIYMAVFGGGQSIVSSGSKGQHVLSSAAGPAIDLVLGMMILFVILPRTKRYGARLCWLFAASTTLLLFWGYMTMDGLGLGSGDFANLSKDTLGSGRIWMGVIGLLGLSGFSFLLILQIFKTLVPYFAFSSYGRRFFLLFLFFGLPNVLYFGITKLLSPGRTMIQTVLQASIAIVIPALLGLFPQKSGLLIQRLPRQPLWVGLSGFCAVLLIWIGVFGPIDYKPNGLLWARPEENRVSVCNINVSLRRDAMVHIDFAMRPYRLTWYGGPLFWRKVRDRTPDWETYERFVQKNLPVLIGVSDFKVIERINDQEFPFYDFYYRDKGARRITAVASLAEKLQKPDEHSYALELTDFWRVSQGYVDRLRIALEEGMKLSGYEIIPSDSNKPDVFSEREILWENKDSRAPEKIKLFFTSSYFQHPALSGPNHRPSPT